MRFGLKRFCCECNTCASVSNLPLQAGLSPIRVSQNRAAFGKYGFKKEFTLASADIMRELLAEIRKRYLHKLSTASKFANAKVQSIADVLPQRITDCKIIVCNIIPLHIPPPLLSFLTVPIPL